MSHLEQSVQALVTQLERTEQRYERTQRQFRLMSLIFGAFMLATILFAVFRVEFVEKAEAGVISALKMDMQNLNTILGHMAELLADVNSPEAKVAVSKIDDIINNTHELIVRAKQEEDTIVDAIGRAVTEMNVITKDMKGMVADMSHMRGSMESMVQNFNVMTHDVHIMSVDMHRMSSTVTPTMGQMNHFMRFIPTP